MWVGAVGAIRFTGFRTSDKIRDCWRNFLNVMSAYTRTAVLEVLGSTGFGFAVDFGGHGVTGRRRSVRRAGGARFLTLVREGGSLSLL